MTLQKVEQHLLTPEGKSTLQLLTSEQGAWVLNLLAGELGQQVLQELQQSLTRENGVTTAMLLTQLLITPNGRDILTAFASKESRRNLIYFLTDYGISLLQSGIGGRGYLDFGQAHTLQSLGSIEGQALVQLLSIPGMIDRIGSIYQRLYQESLNSLLSAPQVAVQESPTGWWSSLRNAPGNLWQWIKGHRWQTATAVGGLGVAAAVGAGVHRHPKAVSARQWIGRQGSALRGLIQRNPWKAAALGVSVPAAYAGYRRWQREKED